MWRERESGVLVIEEGNEIYQRCLNSGQIFLKFPSCLHPLYSSIRVSLCKCLMNEKKKNSMTWYPFWFQRFTSLASYHTISFKDKKNESLLRCKKIKQAEHWSNFTRINTHAREKKLTFLSLYDITCLFVCVL